MKKDDWENAHVKSVRSMIGLPVIRNGERTGRVSGIKFSPDLKCLQGVWTDTGLRGGRFISGEEIEVLGDVSILTAGGGKKEKCAEKLRLRRAVSPDGQRLGAITDLFVDTESRQVLAAELSGGFFDDLIRGRQRIPQFSVRPDGDVVVETPEEGGEGT